MHTSIVVVVALFHFLSSADVMTSDQEKQLAYHISQKIEEYEMGVIIDKFCSRNFSDDLTRDFFNCFQSWNNSCCRNFPKFKFDHRDLEIIWRAACTEKDRLARDIREQFEVQLEELCDAGCGMAVQYDKYSYGDENTRKCQEYLLGVTAEDKKEIHDVAVIKSRLELGIWDKRLKIFCGHQMSEFTEQITRNESEMNRILKCTFSKEPNADKCIAAIDDVGPKIIFLDNIIRHMDLLKTISCFGFAELTSRGGDHQAILDACNAYSYHSFQFKKRDVLRNLQLHNCLKEWWGSNKKDIKIAIERRVKAVQSFREDGINRELEYSLPNFRLGMITDRLCQGHNYSEDLTKNFFECYQTWDNECCRRYMSCQVQSYDLQELFMVRCDQNFLKSFNFWAADSHDRMKGCFKEDEGSYDKRQDCYGCITGWREWQSIGDESTKKCQEKLLNISNDDRAERRRLIESSVRLKRTSQTISYFCSYDIPDDQTMLQVFQCVSSDDRQVEFCMNIEREQKNITFVPFDLWEITCDELRGDHESASAQGVVKCLHDLNGNQQDLSFSREKPLMEKRQKLHKCLEDWWIPRKDYMRRHHDLDEY